MTIIIEHRVEISGSFPSKQTKSIGTHALIKKIYSIIIIIIIEQVFKTAIITCNTLMSNFIWVTSLRSDWKIHRQAMLANVKSGKSGENMNSSESLVISKFSPQLKSKFIKYILFFKKVRKLNQNFTRNSCVLNFKLAIVVWFEQNRNLIRLTLKYLIQKALPFNGTVAIIE